MDIFKDYRLIREDDGYVLLLYLSEMHTELSEEICGGDEERCRELNKDVEKYVKDKFPELKIKLVKVIMGSLLAASFAIGTPHAKAADTTQSTYIVVSGDSLYTIAKRFNTTIEGLKSANSLTSDLIRVGQVLKIPAPPQLAVISYTVVAGDNLSLISARFNTTIIEILHLNNLSSTTIYPGQILKIPSVQTTIPAPAPSAASYKVVAGDTLWLISGKFNTTVDKLKALNNLTTSTIYPGQLLTVPAVTTPPAAAPKPPITEPSITYVNHTVASGENLWMLSIRYGIPMSELMKVNNFNEGTVLNIGQVIRVPVHTIPVISTPGPQYGEYLDWWTQAQYVFPINKTARIIDFQTGRFFNVKRTIGANHSDTEPLTSQDSAIIKEIWGGFYSWKTRAVLVEVDGRRIAASMTSMPHGIEYIGPNDFNGHFDIHFLNSTRHDDGTIDAEHQAQVKIASGK